MHTACSQLLTLAHLCIIVCAHCTYILNMYTVLCIQQGERGLGAGVTASFYSAVAVALQQRSTNAAMPVWVDNDSLGAADGYVYITQSQ
jgi:hypothetical protein